MSNENLNLAMFKRLNKLCKFTPEQKRMFCATLAVQMGYGGISAVAKELNISPKTIRQGISELNADSLGETFQNIPASTQEQKSVSSISSVSIEGKGLSGTSTYTSTDHNTGIFIPGVVAGMAADMANAMSAGSSEYKGNTLAQTSKLAITHIGSTMAMGQEAIGAAMVGDKSAMTDAAVNAVSDVERAFNAVGYSSVDIFAQDKATTGAQLEAKAEVEAGAKSESATQAKLAGQNGQTEAEQAQPDEAKAESQTTQDKPAELPGLFDKIFATHEAALEGDAEALAKLASFRSQAEIDAERKAEEQAKALAEAAKKAAEEAEKAEAEAKKRESITIQKAARELLEKNSSRFAINGLRKTTLTAAKLTELLTAQGFVTNKDAVIEIILDLGFEPDTLRINQVDESLLEDDDNDSPQSLDDVFEAMNEVLEKQAEKRKQDAIAAAEAKALEAAKNLGKIKEQERAAELASQHATPAHQANSATSATNTTSATTATTATSTTGHGAASAPGTTSTTAIHGQVYGSDHPHVYRNVHGQAYGSTAQGSTPGSVQGSVQANTTQGNVSQGSIFAQHSQSVTDLAAQADYKTQPSRFGPARLIDKNPALAQAAREILEQNYLPNDLWPNGMRKATINGARMAELLAERGFTVSPPSGMRIMNNLGYEPIKGLRFQHSEYSYKPKHGSKPAPISTAEAWANAVAAAEKEREQDKNGANGTISSAMADAFNAAVAKAIKDDQSKHPQQLEAKSEIKDEAQVESKLSTAAHGQAYDAAQGSVQSIASGSAQGSVQSSASGNVQGSVQATTTQGNASQNSQPVIDLAAKADYKTQPSRFGPARLIDKDPALAQAAREILEQNYLPNDLYPNGMRQATINGARMAELLAERGFTVSPPSGMRIMKSLGYMPIKGVRFRHGERSFESETAVAQAETTPAKATPFLDQALPVTDSSTSSASSASSTLSAPSKAEESDSKSLDKLDYWHKQSNCGPTPLIFSQPKLAETAKQLLEESVIPGRVTENGNRITSMTIKSLTQKLVDLGFKISSFTVARIFQYLGFESIRSRNKTEVKSVTYEGHADDLYSKLGLTQDEVDSTITLPAYLKIVKLLKFALDYLKQTVDPTVTLENGYKLSTITPNMLKDYLVEHGFPFVTGSATYALMKHFKYESGFYAQKYKTQEQVEFLPGHELDFKIMPRNNGSRKRYIDTYPEAAKVCHEILCQYFTGQIVDGMRQASISSFTLAKLLKQRGFNVSYATTNCIAKYLYFKTKSLNSDGAATLDKPTTSQNAPEAHAPSAAVTKVQAPAKTQAQAQARAGAQTKAGAKTQAGAQVPGKVLPDGVSPLDRIKTPPYEFYVAPNITGNERCIDHEPKLTKLAHSILSEKCAPMANYFGAEGQILLRNVQITTQELTTALNVLGYKNLQVSDSADIMTWLGYAPVEQAVHGVKLPVLFGSLVSLKVQANTLSKIEKASLKILMNYDKAQLPDQEIYTFMRPDKLITKLVEQGFTLQPQEVDPIFAKLGFTRNVRALIKAKQSGFNLYQVFEVEGMQGKVFDPNLASSKNRAPGQFKLYETTPEVLVLVRNILETHEFKINPLDGVRYIQGVTIAELKAKMSIFGYEPDDNLTREMCHILGFETTEFQK